MTEAHCVIHQVDLLLAQTRKPTWCSTTLSSQSPPLSVSIPSGVSNMISWNSCFDLHLYHNPIQLPDNQLRLFLLRRISIPETIESWRPISRDCSSDFLWNTFQIHHTEILQPTLCTVLVSPFLLHSTTLELLPVLKLCRFPFPAKLVEFTSC